MTLGKLRFQAPLYFLFMYLFNFTENYELTAIGYKVNKVLVKVKVLQRFPTLCATSVLTAQIKLTLMAASNSLQDSKYTYTDFIEWLCIP